MKLQNVLLFFLLLFQIALIAQTEGTLTDDAYIKSNGNNNDGSTLNVDASNSENTYLKFTIPNGISVNSVRLELKSQNPSVTGIQIYKSNNTTWSESTVNNGSRPTMDTELTILAASTSGANIARWDIKRCNFSPGEVVTLILTRNTGGKTVFLSKEQGAGVNRPKLFINQSTDNSNCGSGGNIPATGVTLMPANVSMDVNDMEQLTASVVPSNATNQSVTYTSNDDAIATVDNNGLVTAVAEGDATITVTTVDGNHMATSTIMVNDPNNSGGGGGDSPWITGANDAIYYSTGNVGIGVATPNDRLVVAGTIRGQRVRILSETDLNFPDYVFAPEYELLSLEAVEKYIQDNHHLPEVPSAKEINEKGFTVAEMDATLLKKIEELTLYMIELKKSNDLLQKEVSQLKEQLNQQD